MQDAETRAAEFLEIAHQFHLGDLPTEQAHPLTRHLSDLAQQNLPVALKVLHTVDALALSLLTEQSDAVALLAHRIQLTLNERGRIFLCGCGATGRLSLVCETLWRLEHNDTQLAESVIAFMAGGDAALIRSIENFEDHPDYGARQLMELGFRNGDLFIGCTEGGETPFVIGALQAALDVSDNPPFFLYCNPDDVLCRAAERSARVIRNDQVEKINLTVGAMAVTGSTRMQASTVLMAALGAALLHYDRPGEIPGFLRDLSQWWDSCDTAFLAPFIAREAECYRCHEYLLYEVSDDLAISVLTDTTERSPTFSMIPFENALVPADPHSLCYLHMPDAGDSAMAWERLLLRRPRPLNWPDIGRAASGERLLGFDFSAGLARRRLLGAKGSAHRGFIIRRKGQALSFELDELTARMDTAGLSPLASHLILKMLLNMHSTLTMGRLGRFDGNIMTFVRPTNNKLIDRAVRYAVLLAKRKGVEAAYEKAVRACFDVLGRVNPDESVVHAMVGTLTSQE